jgi:hypothetical protein
VGPVQATVAADVQLKAKSKGEIAFVGNLQATSGRAGAEVGQRLTLTATAYPAPAISVEGAAISQTGSVTGKANTNFEVTATGAVGNFRLEAGLDFTAMATVLSELAAAAGAVVDESAQAVEDVIDDTLQRVPRPPL